MAPIPTRGWKDVPRLTPHMKDVIVSGRNSTSPHAWRRWPIAHVLKRKMARPAAPVPGLVVEAHRIRRKRRAHVAAGEQAERPRVVGVGAVADAARVGEQQHEEDGHTDGVHPVLRPRGAVACWSTTRRPNCCIHQR